MPKEWVLNNAMNRWQLNRPRYVGRVAEEIRKCAPKSLEEWERYYFSHVRPRLCPPDISTEEWLQELGRRLYMKITENLRAEIDEVTEDDCIAYVRELVIQRTYQGYVTEKRTVYEQLQSMLGVPIQPAPDEWDRRYNVDFFIRVGDNYIGLQIKPITFSQTPELHQWREWIRKSHKRFEKEQGGKVFIVFSLTEGRSKRIWNEEVVEAIRDEISRLSR